MSDFDSPWKEALGVYFEPFMAFFFPEAHADVEWVDVESVECLADIVVRVAMDYCG